MTLHALIAHQTLTVRSSERNTKQIVVLDPCIRMTANHAHKKKKSSRSRNICVFASRSHLQNQVLTSRYRIRTCFSSLVLYGRRSFVVMSAVVLATTMNSKPEQSFFWRLFTLEHNTLLVLLRKMCFHISFLFNTTSCQKIFHRFVLCNFTGILYKTSRDIFVSRKLEKQGA
jgi:hypothetical protein